MENLQHHLDVVFFVYGLSFVVMGVAILAQLRKDSKYPLAGILWLLAVFGVTHGINEFLDMWTIIKGEIPALDLVRLFCLIISFIFLFEFGIRLLRIAAMKHPRLPEKFAVMLDWCLYSAVALLIFIHSLKSVAFMVTSSVLVRYFLGFPSGVLTGLGLLFYYKVEREDLEALKVKRYFISSGVAFLAYGVLSGLIVTKVNLFPATYLNSDLFLSVVRIPVQIFRAACALIIALSIVKMLRIFGAEVENQFKRSYEFTRAILDSMNDAISIISVSDFTIVDVNEAFMKEYGIKEKSQVIGKTCYEVTHKRHDACSPPDDRCPLIDAVKNGAPVAIEHVHYDMAGGKKHVEVTASPIKNEKGEILQVVHTSRDFAERKLMEEQLYRMSMTDELTGLLNRRGFYTFCEQQLKLSKRQNRGIYLLYADLDNLKKINDAYGHHEGDVALSWAAAIIKECFRDSDIIARIGGDEFVVLPIGFSENHLEKVIERFLKKVENYNENIKRDYKLSLSTGTAYYDPSNPCSIDELLMQADKSMYENKRSKLRP
jgi:diguanylate cyclase (GGDEF)-like protein/PAS domain S-box-containing protein